MQGEFCSLAFQIRDLPSCTFQVDDIKPKISFAEAAENSLFVVACKIDNLRMDLGTHLLRQGCVPDTNKNTIPANKLAKNSLNAYMGKALILDVSFLFETIKPFFDQHGVLKINLDDEDACERYIQELDKIVLTKEIVLELLKKSNCSLKELNGLCFYTGLSQFWTYHKFESWNHIYFTGLELSNDLSDLILESNFSFLGVDTFKFGHTFLNFCELETMFIHNNNCKKIFKDKLKNLQKNPTKYYLLNQGIILYQSLNIGIELVNKHGEFIGLPLPISMEAFDNASITNPIFKVI